MPFVRITLSEEHAQKASRTIADGVHRALVETANVPLDDRFQVVEVVAKANLFSDPGYLGIKRKGPPVFIQIFLNQGRTVEVKKALYARIAENISAEVRKEDILVNLVEVPRENWSFGSGLMSYPPST